MNAVRTGQSHLMTGPATVGATGRSPVHPLHPTAGDLPVAPTGVTRSSYAIAPVMRALLGALLLVAAAGAARAEIVQAPGELFNVPVQSYTELRFKNVVKQGNDLSCGAAALATLLTYFYGLKIDEKKVIDAILAMSNEEDKQKIQTYGFSMLELKRFGERVGFAAGGFRVTKVEDLAKLRVPAITLINIRGYKHFVVIKGMSEGRVFVADPAFGNRTRPLSRFAKEWNGTILVFLSNQLSGKPDFAFEGAPRGRERDVIPMLDQGLRTIAPLPGSGEF